eukprot:CAMPEP_0117436000 /NCGR_PEP_ID=MMETSP0759-20121206/782_1 /TAXON_ID=63605 /ORGANISM="Percolomonas cosmopolitus, Strain WS" /LENGTH=473 /DNA_ID=CAMNT_0005227587 /DNA_START=76 /DNA_END=1497 /DNA_ORIENTATION=-
MNKSKHLLYKLRRLCKNNYLNSHASQEKANTASLNEQIEASTVQIEASLQEQNIQRHASYATVPQFFFGKKRNFTGGALKSQKSVASTTKSPTSIELELKKQSRNRFIQYRRKLILSSEELDAVWDALLNSASEPIIVDQERIDYDSFRYYVALCIADLQRRNEYFSSDIFARLARDELGRISIPDYFNFVLRKGSLIESRLDLLQFDSDFDNILTTEELKQYIEYSISKIDSLKELKPDFKKIYIQTAIRKFIFILDPHKRGKFHIDDLLQSQVFQEFQELHNEEMTENEKMSNWFTLPSTFSVYETFKQLNFSSSGCLSRNEMLSFNEGSLTRIFVERLMQEYVLHKHKKIDYNLFVDFILAYENKETNQGKRFFWKILDVYKMGYLTPLVVSMFFQEILKKLKTQQGVDDYEMKDLIVEVYSMINPKSQDGDMTLQDFLNSKQGGTCILMMIDSLAFYNYDTREQQSQQS